MAIDYFLKFTDENAAITAATGSALGQFDAQNNWHWNTHFVNPNVQAWRISQDNADGTHNYLAGWYAIVAVQKRNAQLDNDPSLQFCLNRDGPPYVLINKIGAVLTDVAAQPIFAGSHYPIGGIN
jgi:hypothetical protein